MKAEHEIAVDVVELYQTQKRQLGDVNLEGIKVSFPNGCDVQKVMRFIHITHPNYLLNLKKQKGKEMLTIGEL